jgi:hypothetical protein
MTYFESYEMPADQPKAKHWRYEVAYVQDGRLKCKDFSYDSSHEPLWTDLPEEVGKFVDTIQDCEYYVYVLQGDSCCTHWNGELSKSKDDQEKYNKKLAVKKQKAHMKFKAAEKEAAVLDAAGDRWDDIG